MPRATIFPKSHYVTPRETIEKALGEIHDELIIHLKYLKDNNKLVKAQRLEQRTRIDLEMIKEMGYCSGLENYDRYMSGRASGEGQPPLYDYLPDDALRIRVESQVRITQLGA